ncbi:hypothetical protein, partial [Salmonella enterica]|uniref:hypothetical protein n=1 Tax=Salmonella enterica TaxID=28901 RepID=UPI00398C4892
MLLPTNALQPHTLATLMWSVTALGIVTADAVLMAMLLKLFSKYDILPLTGVAPCMPVTMSCLAS